jgi:hypothetical protein
MYIEFPVPASGGSDIVLETVIASGPLDEEVDDTGYEECVVDDAAVDEMEDD